MSGERKDTDIIDNLIEKVDDPVCGWNQLSIRMKIVENIFNIVKIIVLFFYAAVLLFALILLPFITKLEYLLPIGIAIIALMLNATAYYFEALKPTKREEMTRVITDWNFERIKKGVESKHWLLLKALIWIKTLQEEFKLSEVRRECPSLFNKDALIRMLYSETSS